MCYIRMCFHLSELIYIFFCARFWLFLGVFLQFQLLVELSVFVVSEPWLRVRSRSQIAFFKLLFSNCFFSISKLGLFIIISNLWLVVNLQLGVGEAGSQGVTLNHVQSYSRNMATLTGSFARLVYMNDTGAFLWAKQIATRAGASMFQPSQDINGAIFCDPLTTLMFAPAMSPTPARFIFDCFENSPP